MPFHVICTESEIPYCTIIGIPDVFPDGRTAAAWAQEMSQRDGKKYRPRPIASDEWRQREQSRFDSGTYQRLPWHDAAWLIASGAAKDHFAHVSTERDGMVAFTESPEKGAADRQTRMRPGAYLQRYFPELGADKIQEMARDFAGKFEDNTLLFATSADEIERVYTTGPNSCMSGEARRYDSPFHPVRVYAAGDLAVAYVMRGGHIVGRALAWPEQKKYSRIYGDEDRLAPLLGDAGYRQGSLAGARLTRHRCNGGFVCPYIDWDYTVEDRGDFLHISGDIQAESTNGLIDVDEGEYCEHCDSHGHDESDMNYISDIEAYWCESCANDDAYTCEATSNRYARERNVIRMANGDYWSRDHFERYGFICDGDGEAYHCDDAVSMDNGETWSQSHFESHGFQCPECRENFANSDGVETMDGMHCEDCAPEPDESSDGALSSERRHIARQGRDESPSQLEMTLSNAPFHPGDIVRLNFHSPRGFSIMEFRRAHRYPEWTHATELKVSAVYHSLSLRFELSDNPGLVLGHSRTGETWEGDNNGFILVRRNGESV